MGAVLSTLASMSRAMPALSVPGVDLLSRIGTSFLKSNQDDVIGHYTVTLVQPSRQFPTADPILQVSDIIVRRTNDRQTNLSFAGCRYAMESGAILGCPQMQQDTFLVLSLRKSTSATSIVPQVTLDELNQRIAKAAGSAALQSTLDEIVNEAVSAGAGQTAIALVDRVKDPKEPAAVREFDAIELVKSLQCYVVVSTSTDDSVTQSLCGPSAKERQMSRGDFDNVARRVIGAKCLEPAELSATSLVPELTSDAVNGARRTLTAAMVTKCTA
jgi:hypothetical protein